VEFSDVRASLRRHWPVALVILVIIPMVMAVYLVRRDVVRPPARFTTSVDVLIPARDVETGAAPEDVPPVLLQGQTELANSDAVRREARENAGLDPVGAGDRIGLAAELQQEATIMRLSVSAPNPELAEQVIDGYITAYEDGRRRTVLEAALDLQEIERRVIGVLQRKIDTVEAELTRRGVPFPTVVLDQNPDDEINPPRGAVPDGASVPVPPNASSEDVLLLYERNALLNEIQRRQVNYSLQSTRAEIPAAFTTVVQRRTTARVTPPPPSPVIPLVTIFVGGLLLAIAVPVVLDRLDSTITEARAAPGALRAGLLATIPFMPRRLHRTLAPPGSSWELAFRSLAATSIATDRLPSAIMVTSPAGTTQDTVAANFAVGLAGLGAKVALIATTERQGWYVDAAPVVGQDQFDEDPPADDGVAAAAPSGAPVPVGGQPLGSGTRRPATFDMLLREAHEGRLNGQLLDRLAHQDIANLYVVPPGADDADLMLDGLPPLLEAMDRSGIDVTVVAGPAFLTDPNATIMAWSIRHVLWAIEIGHVDKNDAHLAADRLELAGVEPFGIALVNRSALRA
jgi:Mrp family chromosome partitioning ATPase